MVCGGTMWIHIEPGAEALADGRGGRLDALLPAAELRPVALGTLLTIEGREVRAVSHTAIDTLDESQPAMTSTFSPSAREAVREAFHRGAARLVRLDSTREMLIEPIVSRPRLVIAGAGHVALALADLASHLDYDLTVIDDRAEFANVARFPGAEVLVGDIAATLAGLSPGWNTFIVVATRGHRMDAHCLRAAVGTRARYVGLLGSHRKTILIDKMLRAEGTSEMALESVHAPIGLDLGGRTPAEIALSILAELSLERYGGSGRPLRRR
jgi:xanthine dehydrogenase accessory factor